MTLPLLLSVPHGGARVPRWLRHKCLLDGAQLLADGDVGAAQIYALRDEVAAFVSTPVARAVLDMNRAPDDHARADGVVKTTTCWQEPVWREPLTEAEVARLLRLHARYHGRLAAARGRVLAGVDCHTMSDVGPPIGPDPGAGRPTVCIGHVGGSSCPADWARALQDAFAARFDGAVTIDDPFAGGYVTRRHAAEMPWVQVELARTTQETFAAQRAGVLAALKDWCSWLSGRRAARRLPRAITPTSKEDEPR